MNVASVVDGAARVSSSGVGSSGVVITVCSTSSFPPESVMVTDRGPHSGAVSVPETLKTGFSIRVGVMRNVARGSRVHH